MTAQELAQMIWSIKELIRDDYNDKDVDQVILPFTLLRRLDCVLEDKQGLIQEALEQIPEEKREALLPQFLKLKGVPFYNLSGLTLNKMLANPVAIADNFKTYLQGFSANIKDILYNFTGGEENGLGPIYQTLARKGLLYKVTQEFCVKADLHPRNVDNHMMGTVFETIIRYSKESTNEAAGQYYTPREIVRLLVRLVLCGQEERIHEEGQNFSLYDPACGTGGMLTVAKDYLQEQTDRKMIVRLYGQELNEQTYAICKSDILMKDEDASGIRLGNTLTDDKAAGKTFNYMITNPPFGVDWKKSEEAIKKEAEDPHGRFSAGLPSTSDGSLLFLMHMIHKMDPKGARIGIVLNGSPLFNGDAGSGWSEIRKSLLDRDLLDAIVALPKNLFYGTDISSYLWILDNNKPASHRGKVLFVNAAHDDFATLLQRSLGKKRYEISDKTADQIVELYRKYAPATMTLEGEEQEVSKLMDTEDFLYTKVSVQRPLRLRYKDVSKKIAELLGEGSETKIAKKDAEYLAELQKIGDIDTERTDAEFFEHLRRNGQKRIAAGMIKKIRGWLGTTDEGAPEVYETPGDAETGKVADSNLSDTESIPMKQDIDKYFETEVLKFVPDAWMDRTKDKIGCEFPFTKLFYRYKPLRTSEEIMAELEALDAEMAGLMSNLR